MGGMASQINGSSTAQQRVWANNTGNIKGPHYWLFARGIQWILSKRGINAESISKSWHHNDHKSKAGGPRCWGCATNGVCRPCGYFYDYYRCTLSLVLDRCIFKWDTVSWWLRILKRISHKDKDQCFLPCQWMANGCRGRLGAAAVRRVVMGRGREREPATLVYMEGQTVRESAAKQRTALRYTAPVSPSIVM